MENNISVFLFEGGVINQGVVADALNMVPQPIEGSLHDYSVFDDRLSQSSGSITHGSIISLDIENYTELVDYITEHHPDMQAYSVSPFNEVTTEVETCSTFVKK